MYRDPLTGPMAIAYCYSLDSSIPCMKPGGCNDAGGINRNRPRYYFFSLPYSSNCLNNNNVYFSQHNNTL